jgi:transposase
LVALAHTTLCVVTWHGAHNVSPVTKWGQLLAYMPQVRRHADQARDGVVVTLPSPVLRVSHVARATNLARARAEVDSTSWNERRSANVRLMLAELDRRGARDLAAVLDR